MYTSAKKFGGFSAAFRQHRAESHCRYLHGYNLEFVVTFECDDDALDSTNWCVDFGGLKALKGLLEASFDHKTVIAADDPQFPLFKEMQAAGIIQLVIMPATGCEKFAEYAYEVATQWLVDTGHSSRVRVRSVQVSEHGANSATYRRQYA